MKFIVIGITDNPQPFFPPEVLEIIKAGKVFSGGKRHHEIVESLLPDDAEWIDITVPLDDVFDNYQLANNHYPLMPIVVFAVLTALVGMFPAQLLNFFTALAGGLL